MPALRLTYFAIPGRGEPTRVVLRYGGVAFEDHRIGFAQWPELKPTTPFGEALVIRWAVKWRWRKKKLPSPSATRGGNVECMCVFKQCERGHVSLQRSRS